MAEHTEGWWRRRGRGWRREEREADAEVVVAVEEVVDAEVEEMVDEDMVDAEVEEMVNAEDSGVEDVPGAAREGGRAFHVMERGTGNARLGPGLDPRKV